MIIGQNQNIIWISQWILITQEKQVGAYYCILSFYFYYLHFTRTIYYGLFYFSNFYWWFRDKVSIQFGEI